MIYKSDEEFHNIVRSALMEEKVDEELIKKIVKLADEMHGSRSPVFNALEFLFVHNNDKSVKVRFKSTLRGVVDYIDIDCYYDKKNDRMVMFDSNKLFKFIFNKEKTFLYFLCDGENTVVFVGEKPNEGEKTYNYVQKKGGFSTIHFYVFMYTNTIDLAKVFETENYYCEYSKKMDARKLSSTDKDYVFVTKETNSGAPLKAYAIEDLEDLNTCLKIAINLYCERKEDSIDKYEHMIR